MCCSWHEAWGFSAALCQVSELEQPMDEGDRAPLVESDFPEDALQEKSANMVQVETGKVELFCRN